MRLDQNRLDRYVPHASISIRLRHVSPKTLLLAIRGKENRRSGRSRPRPSSVPKSFCWPPAGGQVRWVDESCWTDSWYFRLEDPNLYPHHVFFEGIPKRNHSDLSIPESVSLIFRWFREHPQKLNSSFVEKFRAPKGKDHLPTMIFQGRCC